MSASPVRAPLEEFLAAAEAVAVARPEVDLEMAREVFREAATLLYNGLALDGLDEHDWRAVVAGLCIDLVCGGSRRRGPCTLRGSVEILRRPA